MTMLKQMLFRYQGQVGAALVLGGCDPTGAHLFTVAPHGSTVSLSCFLYLHILTLLQDKLPYVSMGSGSLAAMAVLESTWKPKMTVRPSTSAMVINLTVMLQREQAIEVVANAISAGIFNDLGSGFVGLSIACVLYLISLKAPISISVS